jgi:predicted NUDIX family NTP pyrophosphohydrolase
LLFRQTSGALEVFLVHPGGPFWVRKDAGAWTIPKGEPSTGESALDAARREFVEETGFRPAGEFRALTPVRQKGGKLIHAWAVEGDCDPADIESNTFALEWPPKSGRVQQFPEIDRAGWFSVDAARSKLIAGQLPLLDELAALVGEVDGHLPQG